MKACKPSGKLRRTNLTAEQVALANPSRVTNTAFLTLKRRSSSPELQVQDDEDVDMTLTRMPDVSPSRDTSPDRYPDDRPTSPSSTGFVSSSHPTSASLAVARTRTKKRAKSVAKFQDGAVIGKRPKAADYEEVVVALLVRAMFDYEGLVSTNNAFPDVSLRRQWTLRCWKQALKDADEWIEISERMMTLVRKLAMSSLSQSDVSSSHR